MHINIPISNHLFHEIPTKYLFIECIAVDSTIASSVLCGCAPVKFREKFRAHYYSLHEDVQKDFSL